MKRNFAPLALLFVLSLSFSLLQAQAVRNVVEDVNQKEADAETLQRNKGELSQFRGYAAGFGAAIDAGNVQLAQGHHIKMVTAMEREISQAEAKVNGRDLEDGKTELAEHHTRLDRQRTIAAEIKALVVDSKNLAVIKTKMNLLEEFEQIMVRDLGEAPAED